jgi:hypothetical protein
MNTLVHVGFALFVCLPLAWYLSGAILGRG